VFFLGVFSTFQKFEGSTLSKVMMTLDSGFPVKFQEDSFVSRGMAVICLIDLRDP